MSFIHEVRNDMEREAMRLLREYRLALFKEAVRLCGDVHTAEDLKHGSKRTKRRLRRFALVRLAQRC